jgi:crossover junction endodeoxyribonuclease RusA
MTNARGPWVIRLPWTAPPLSLNDRSRSHWPSTRKRRQVRGIARVLAHQAGVPALEACVVQLHYVPRDRRRRDTDNLVATLKPLADGLVDAGVVTDDTPQLMSKPEPRIEAPDSRDPHLYLVITERTPT